MIFFSNLDPLTLATDRRIILEYSEDSVPDRDKDYYYLLIDNGFCIWAYRSLMRAYEINGVISPEKWLGGTLIEFPKKALPWFIETIEQKFFKTEAEGGLKKGEFTDSKLFDDEKIVVSRWFGTPGYGLANFSRQNHSYQDIQKQQEFCFTDQMLFDNGLFNQLKQLGDRISRGEL